MNVSEIWKCSECGDNRIEEAITGIAVSRQVLVIDYEGYTTYGGEIANNNGAVEGYRCVGCGLKVGEVNTIEGLFEALVELADAAKDNTSGSEDNASSQYVVVGISSSFMEAVRGPFVSLEAAYAWADNKGGVADRDWRVAPLESTKGE